MTRPVEIELHVGHYGDGTGAKKLVDEVQYARKFIKRIYDILVANKVPATYYEDKVSKNQTQNINHLVAHHNKDTNGFIVSGHLNASAGIVEKSIGSEVLFYDQLGVAQNVVNAICKSSGMSNRGAKKRTDLGVLVRTYEPAILIEFGFVNSRKDVELMDKHFESICQAVARELAAHIGHEIVEDKKEQVVECVNDGKLYRVQSGTFNTKAQAEAARQALGKYNIAKPEYVQLVQDSSNWRFITGTYPSQTVANNAITEMKRRNIIAYAESIPA